MIKGLQKLGGVAALIAAMTLVVGIGMFATVMSGYINIFGINITVKHNRFCIHFNII